MIMEWYRELQKSQTSADGMDCELLMTLSTASYSALHDMKIMYSEFKSNGEELVMAHFKV